MKKILIVLFFFLSSASVMAIGFPVNNAYVHQRMEQSKSMEAKAADLQSKMLVGVASPAESEPIELKPTSFTFIQWMGAVVMQWISKWIPLS